MREFWSALFGGSITIVLIVTVVVLVGAALILWSGRKID